MMFRSFGRDISRLDIGLSPDQLVMGTVPLVIFLWSKLFTILLSDFSEPSYAIRSSLSVAISSRRQPFKLLGIIISWKVFFFNLKTVDVVSSAVVRCDYE